MFDRNGVKTAGLTVSLVHYFTSRDSEQAHQVVFGSLRLFPESKKFSLAVELYYL
jgi:hypothetical protein